MTKKSEILTVEEIWQRYPDEWVLMEITRDHRHPMRKRGRVLAHGVDRRPLDDAYWQFRAENRTARTFEFYAGEVVPEGYTVVV